MVNEQSVQSGNQGYPIWSKPTKGLLWHKSQICFKWWLWEEGLKKGCVATDRSVCPWWPLSTVIRNIYRKEQNRTITELITEKFKVYVILPWILSSEDDRLLSTGRRGMW